MPRALGGPRWKLACWVNRGSVAIFGRDASVQNSSGLSLLDLHGAAVDSATFCWRASGRRNALCACDWPNIRNYKLNGGGGKS